MIPGDPGGNRYLNKNWKTDNPVLEWARETLKMARYCIGTSGWHYDDWRGRFYPEKLPKTQWLEFYTRHFTTLEINNTFYRLPKESVFEKWYESSPEGFVFSVKVSRFITHIKRLKDCGNEVDKFMSRAALLKEKLGPVLYQLPPGLHRDDEVLANFLSVLPPGPKHVIEFRHESWFTEDVYKIMRQNHTGFCIFDMPKLTSPVKATANFAYIRFHGSGSLYSSCYSDEELREWEIKISELAEGLEAVYVYFNNDVQGFAIKNAATIKEHLEK
jgi:uncharacterized protein YecE (DUF72 family)